VRRNQAPRAPGVRGGGVRRGAGRIGALSLTAAPMPTTPLQRLLFAQGGDCFFCRRPLGKAEASVEHLVALTHGGKDNDENCVACCKALNNLFGRMSLKEKLQIVLNQRGNFVCPASAQALPAPPSARAAKSPPKQDRTHADRFDLVVADLHKRGNARPGTVDKLLNTIRCQLASLGEPEGEADALLGELRARDFVRVEGTKVRYCLQEPGNL
jgi:hypothetical protein